MPYPDAINLPFNLASISDGFIPVRPGEEVPEGPGFWAVLRGNALVVTEGEEGLSLPEGERPAWSDAGREPLCVGLWQGRPLWAVALGSKVPLPSPFTAEPFNAVEERLDDRLLTIGGLAHQVLQWERRSTVCSLCGGGLDPVPGTWGKKCSACRHEHYPHIHPCIIVLVKRGDEFLLIRKPEWPVGRYSLIAGFVDFGESLEECVRRETEEEAGIRVCNVRYVGSQSWPFPSQLMCGFVAEYAGGDVLADAVEVEDARWFSPENLPESLPGRRSIARWIIDRFALDLS